MNKGQAIGFSGRDVTDKSKQSVSERILSLLTSNKKYSQKELAKRLRISPATVTVSLKSMERDGYIKKHVSADDLRCKPISITEKGRQAVKVIDEVYDALDHSMYRGFSPEEMEMISGFYRRIIENLDAVMSGVEES